VIKTKNYLAQFQGKNITNEERFALRVTVTDGLGTVSDIRKKNRDLTSKSEFKQGKLQSSLLHSFSAKMWNGQQWVQPGARVAVSPGSRRQSYAQAAANSYGQQPVQPQRTTANGSAGPDSMTSGTNHPGPQPLLRRRQKLNAPRLGEGTTRGGVLPRTVQNNRHRQAPPAPPQSSTVAWRIHQLLQPVQSPCSDQVSGPVWSTATCPLSGHAGMDSIVLNHSSCHHNSRGLTASSNHPQSLSNLHLGTPVAMRPTCRRRRMLGTRHQPRSPQLPAAAATPIVAI
jgi:hypothetical protein